MRWLAILMIVAILGITGFQLYWLRQNYDREKKSLSIKTEMTFRESVIQLLVSKQKLDSINFEGRSGKGSLRFYMTDGPEKHMNVNNLPKPETISSINVVTSKFSDSQHKTVKGPTIVTVNNTKLQITNDSAVLTRVSMLPSKAEKEGVFNLLYGTDSLKNPLQVNEIDSLCRKKFQREMLNIPFSILQSKADDGEQGMNKVTIGMANPVTYELQLGNTFPYLFRRILQPVFFSILLLGITILSFILLYRNLLRQQRLAALKNEFISNITHELKTPIATVGVAIEALKNFNAIQDPQRTKEYLDISANELQRLSLLVDKVLKLSMFENKAIELKFEKLNLKEIADEVVTSLKLQLEKKKANVTVEQDGDVQLSGDRLHLMSVVFNLLDNALKYAKENPAIALHIKGTGDNVTLTVTDNGVGIPPEYRDKIFEKFFRVPHGDTHNAKGYGLGLSYAAKVIQQHKGTIRADGNEKGGTTFTISLPKQQG
ncbi:MAG TPA: HAMP domain-containing sensor histidine kinase [Chitinophagaceae bacterium]|nr:HAMP domain-containing sensor histidine kinase [Chitinophagaceae bacterium]